MNINVGDKLLCKESLSTISVDYFDKDKYYIVDRIMYFDNRISWYYIIDNIGLLYSFSNNDTDFYDIFYTKSEIRSIKLKKINEKTES